MLYVRPDTCGQVLAGPVIAPGVGGGAVTDTARLVAGPVPQLFVAATVIVPPAVPAAAIKVAVPCPEVMVHPFGTVQVKVNPATGATL
jgi:hypothetical protein